MNKPGWLLQNVQTRGLHGSQNSYPNPKRPVNMLHGTDPDPYFIWKWDPNPCRPEKCLKCTTRTQRGPDHYSKVGPEPGWEDTDPTAPKKKIAFSLTACDAILFANKFPSMLGCSSLLPTEIAFLIHYSSFKSLLATRWILPLYIHFVWAFFSHHSWRNPWSPTVRLY